MVCRNAATLANPPECGKWSDLEAGLIGVAKQLAAGMCGGHVDAEVLADLQIKHDVAMAQLQAITVSEQAAAKTSWRQWAANAVDAGAFRGTQLPWAR